MLDFSKATFVKSATMLSQRPEKLLPEICFVGKSNVGKSSLINALTAHKKLAYTSSKPGYTKLLNYYLIDDRFYLVDAPGYGYTISGSKHLDNFASMMEDYFFNDNLKAVIFLVDSRHKLSKDDLSFFDFIKENDIPFVLVTTKIDKLNQESNAYKTFLKHRIKFPEMYSNKIIEQMFNTGITNEDKLLIEYNLINLQITEI